MERAGRKKVDKILSDVLITGIADRGKSVGRDHVGEVVFVEGAVPGDRIDVSLRRRKKGVRHGVAVNWHKYSPHRVEPFCAHFDYCGGCKWQHLHYDAQLQYKHQSVVDVMRRIGKLDNPNIDTILGSSKTQDYRNKLEFSFSNKKWLTTEELNKGVSNNVDVLGFHISGAFDKILNIDRCYLQPEPSNRIRNDIKDLAERQGLDFYDARKHSGTMRNVIIRTTATGEVLVNVVFGTKKKKVILNFLSELLCLHSEITSLYYTINTKTNDFLGDLDMVLFEGSERIIEKLGDLKFMIGPKSFFQTNADQAKNLYDLIVEYAGLDGEQFVYDLYSGVGSIALYLAKNAKHVIGIETVEAANYDARENMKLNDIKNCTFLTGDVRDILTNEFAANHPAADVIITDPPRAGMHPKVVRTLLELKIPKIVYVSCNPATQARDIQMLSEQYQVDKMRPVDMFPHTHHLENVALLTLKS